MSNLRYTTDPLATGAWQVSNWDAGQSGILKWSPSNVTWNPGTATIPAALDFTLAAAPAGSTRPFLSGEIQSNQTASTGTWGWTAQVPELVSGSIFGLFTYKADHFRDPWIEFDFEFLGIDAGKYRDASGQIVHDLDGDVDGDGDIDIFQVRLNIHMETRKGGHVTLEDAKGSPVIVTLPFDVTEGFHTYEVTVTGTNAVFTADGVVIGTYSSKDMPGGVWTSGDMKSFVNLWCVDTDLADWAGTWTAPAEPLVGRLAAATYAPLGGTATLIGGNGGPTGPTGPTVPEPVTYERDGTAAADRLVDVAKASTDFRGGAGNDSFCFLQGPRGGTAERDIIWDFNAAGDAVAENDKIEISKAMSGFKGFSALYRAVSDVDGDALLRFADGSTLTFEGVTKAQLGYSDFLLV